MTTIQKESPTTFKLHHIIQLCQQALEARDSEKPAFAERIADTAGRLDKERNPKGNSK